MSRRQLGYLGTQAKVPKPRHPIACKPRFPVASLDTWVPKPRYPSQGTKAKAKATVKAKAKQDRQSSDLGNNVFTVWCSPIRRAHFTHNLSKSIITSDCSFKRTPYQFIVCKSLLFALNYFQGYVSLCMS